MSQTATLEALRCSFCAKSQDDVGTLVAGPGVYICNECVDLSTQIITEKQARGRRRSGAAQTPPVLKAWETLSDEALLAEMVRAHAAHENVDRSVAHHVAALRERGVTWARIGGALGMTRQSAWERFSGEE